LYRFHDVFDSLADGEDSAADYTARSPHHSVSRVGPSASSPSATLSVLAQGDISMAEKTPQTFANHTRFDPLFHFFILPIFGLGVLFTLIHFFAHLSHADFRDNFHAVLLILLALALLTLVLKVRLYSLKLQDRIIRLEERLRLMQILSEPLRSRIPELTEDQLCGLRFASDAEIPKLVERTLNEKLSRKQIKESIQTWRPDYWRV
jgi:hypothetical protein